MEGSSSVDARHPGCRLIRSCAWCVVPVLSVATRGEIFFFSCPVWLVARLLLPLAAGPGTDWEEAGGGAEERQQEEERKGTRRGACGCVRRRNSTWGGRLFGPVSSSSSAEGGLFGTGTSREREEKGDCGWPGVSPAVLDPLCRCVSNVQCSVQIQRPP